MLPDCVAVTVQMPAAKSVTVVPLTVHTEGVVDANCTARPDVEVAARVGGVTPIVCVDGAVKLIVCAPTTKKERVCVVAAA